MEDIETCLEEGENNAKYGSTVTFSGCEGGKELRDISSQSNEQWSGVASKRGHGYEGGSAATEIEVEMLSSPRISNENVRVNVTACKSKRESAKAQKAKAAEAGGVGPFCYDTSLTETEPETDISTARSRSFSRGLSSTSFSDHAGASAQAAHARLTTAVDTLSSFADEYLAAIAADPLAADPHAGRGRPGGAPRAPPRRPGTAARARQPARSAHSLSALSLSALSLSPPPPRPASERAERGRRGRPRKAGGVRPAEGALDFSAVTKPLAEVIVMSQSALLDAFSGKKCAAWGDAMSASSSFYSDDDTNASFSSFDDNTDDDSDSRSDSGDDSDSSLDDNTRCASARGRTLRRGGAGPSHAAASSRQASKGVHSAGGAIKPFLDQITTHGINLHWHTKSHRRARLTQALRVQAHINISDCADCGTDRAQPNLTWSAPPSTDTQHQHDCSSHSKHTSHTHRCSLFDIASVHKATKSSSRILTAYPTIRQPDNCITILKNNGSLLLFEAADAMEAKKLVHGLRWIVARLSFNLIIGNADVCAELLPLPRKNNADAKQHDTLISSHIMNDVTNHLLDKALTQFKHHPTQGYTDDSNEQQSI